MVAATLIVKKPGAKRRCVLSIGSNEFVLRMPSSIREKANYIFEWGYEMVEDGIIAIQREQWPSGHFAHFVFTGKGENDKHITEVQIRKGLIEPEVTALKQWLKELYEERAD